MYYVLTVDNSTATNTSAFTTTDIATGIQQLWCELNNLHSISSGVNIDIFIISPPRDSWNGVAGSKTVDSSRIVQVDFCESRGISY